MTDPVDLEFPGGFLRTVSRTAARGRIIDGDKVRFQNGKWEKIGGWVKLVSTALTGIARGAFGWTSDSGDSLIATGTATKLYSISDMLQDITPLRKTTSPLGNNPFTMVNATPTVTVHDVGHGATTGATVVFSGAAAARGITVVGAYILTVVDADNYTITAANNASSSGTGGGAAVVGDYEINPGLSDSTYGVGYGSGLYNRGTYGTPRAVGNGLSTGGGILNELRTWFFANYGNQLAVLPSGGTVYLWDQPGSAARAVALANAPASGRAMFITEERMIVVLGTTLPMTMQWNDRIAPTNWTASLTSTANTRTLQVGNKLIAGSTFTGGISLVWSDTALYLMQFIGSTGEIYSTRVVAEGCGLLGPCAFARSPDLMAWMGDFNFHVYSGGQVVQAPRQQEIRAYILGEIAENGGRLDRTNAAKIACGHNPRHNEIWWHYVSVDSPNGEPDEYVKVCLDDWSWDTGTLGRSAMTHSEDPLGRSFMMGTDSYVYEHETGKDANGAALPYYMQSGPVALGSGIGDMDVIGFVPDFERQVGPVTLTIRTYERPMSTTPLEDTDHVIQEGDVLIDMKHGGRYADIGLSGDTLGCDFRLGTPQIEVGIVSEIR